MSDSSNVSFSAEAAKSGVTSVVTDLYTLAKKQASSLYDRLSLHWKIPAICKTLTSVRKVKTIFQLEKEIDLKHFYYPSRVTIGKSPKRVETLDDIPFDGNLVIEGTVGQGKSTFLRYLTWVESTKGQYIPLFIELRKYDPSTKLAQYIQEQLSVLGLQTDATLLAFLLGTGKVSLFLDGFDEIADRNRSSVVSELEELAQRYRDTRMIVTSRPDSDIQSSPLFRVISLSPLVKGEYAALLRRVSANTSVADRLISQIETASASSSEGRSVEALLTTPLMVSLLLVKFNVEQSVPENLCDFYRELFIVLLQRHDKSKAGFRRERASKLSDDDIQAVFDALCFTMRREGLASLSRARLRSLLISVCEAERIHADAAAIVKDITSITCLLVEDGGEFHFIHRTVLEFHAARYISAQPDSHAERFYKTVRPKWSSWAEEINFLLELDQYRFAKYFEIPDIRGVLAVFSSSGAKILSSTELIVFTGGLEAELRKVGQMTVIRWSRVRPQASWTGYRALSRRWGELQRALVPLLREKALLRDASSKPFEWVRTFSTLGRGSDVPVQLNIPKMFDAGRLDAKPFACLENEVKKLRVRLLDLEDMVAAKEARRTAFDF